MPPVCVTLPVTFFFLAPLIFSVPLRIGNVRTGPAAAVVGATGATAMPIAWRFCADCGLKASVVVPPLSLTVVVLAPAAGAIASATSATSSIASRAAVSREFFMRCLLWRLPSLPAPGARLIGVSTHTRSVGATEPAGRRCSRRGQPQAGISDRAATSHAGSDRRRHRITAEMSLQGPRKRIADRDTV